MSQKIESNYQSKVGINTPTKHWQPMAMSLLVHIVLVVFLILMAISIRKDAPPGELRRVGITLAVEDPHAEPTEYLSESDLNEPSDPLTETTAQAPSDSPPPPLMTATTTQDRSELPGFMLDPKQFDANSMAAVPNQKETNQQFQLSEEDLKIIEADRKLIRARAPQGDPTTLSVFGGGGMTGRSFVFVIDRSKSMGGQGLDVLNSARDELANAINQLEPVHQFQIVGYHNRTVTISKRELLNATEANKGLVPDFIAGLVAFGPTHHETGLAAAIAFKPDVIVLMTDGGYPVLNAGQLKRIKRQLPVGCRIHCVQFGFGALQKQSNFMTRLASQNQGSFRYVDVLKWKQK